LLADAQKQRDSNLETKEETSTPEGEVYGISPTN